MIRKLANLFVLLPLGIVLIVLSVANRHSVSLAFNPFRPEDEALAISAPFFVFLFLALILGMVIGSLVTWFSQGQYRKRARAEAREAVKWHDEADRQKARAEEMAAHAVAPLPAQLPAK
ncbi:DUF1049 domain-containing protein [Rhizobiaceae bacterium BDR2-2]|uniref:DUF1049 domain-containing protein n=1 Tax=Ectorhizobium quercum TaxID=2965071 RepID=A0AAE3STK1_9HYPH|nr:DUF1049 domain-containing protein [Ectorhizobium quercum]MCX8995768.1 DUF1049 domain-containing protein [Ectorhizobium quercum]